MTFNLVRKRRSETASTPLAGLFLPAEIELVWNAYRFTLITLMDRVNPRVEIVGTVADAMETEGLQNRVDVDRNTLLMKIDGLDPWEARFMLRAIAAMRPLTKSLSVSEAAVEVGLLRPGSRSVILYTCSHSEDTASRCGGAPHMEEAFMADLPCPRCRLQGQMAVDAQRGYAVLSGEPRAAVAAAEGRARLIHALQDGHVTDRGRQALKDVVLRYLKQVPDTS